MESIAEQIERPVSDQARLDALTERFFRVFDNRNGRTIDVESARSLFVVGASITKIKNGSVETMDFAAFMTPRREMLSNGVLSDFHEREELSRTIVAGRLATRWCIYRKEGLRDGVPMAGAGTKAISFVRTGKEWRIASIIWQDQEEGLDVRTVAF
jgi:hypothetical protein